MESFEIHETFMEKYLEVYQDLYRFALYVLKNPHDAEDVVGEAVADAYAGFSKLRSPEAFRAWIFKILSNKCRRRKMEYFKRDAELPEEICGHFASLEDAAAVRMAFFRLEDEERLLIALKVFGGYTSREIGELLDMNENTVRSRISRGLGKMRRWLQE